MAPTTAEPLRCSVFIAQSLDGFIARADGSVDWLSCVERPGEDYGYGAFFVTIDALVIGRNSYETIARRGSWPYAGKRCVVLTHRPGMPRHGEELVAARPDEIVGRLRRDGARRIYVDGGDVIRQFLDARLIDDLTVSVIPVLLGRGIPLFTSGGGEQRLMLQEARSWPSGLVQLRYRVER